MQELQANVTFKLTLFERWERFDLTENSVNYLNLSNYKILPSNLLFQRFTVRLTRPEHISIIHKPKVAVLGCCTISVKKLSTQALWANLIFSVLSSKETFFSSRVILLLSILAWLVRVFDCQIKNAIFPRNSICPGSEKKIASSRDYFYFYGRKYIFLLLRWHSAGQSFRTKYFFT